MTLRDRCDRITAMLDAMVADVRHIDAALSSEALTVMTTHMRLIHNELDHLIQDAHTTPTRGPWRPRR